jgi:translocation and assembly module TamB
MRVRRLLLLIVACALAIALLLLGCVIAVLSSERGTRWSLQLAHTYLPALTIENANGNWLRGLHIERVQWRDNNIDLQLDDLTVRLRWPSLLHNEIKLWPLRVGALRITPLGESNENRVELSRLFLPLILSAPEFFVQQLQIVNKDSAVALDKISGAVQWRGTTLRARGLQVGWQQLQLHGDGELGFRSDYPLRLMGQLITPQWPTPIALTTEGDLRQLIIHATTAQPYALRSDIKLATLDKHLPLEIVAELTQPIGQQSPTGDIKINTANFAVRGDLTRIDATLTASADEPHYGATQLVATAQWQPEQLHATAHWQLNAGTFDAECNATFGATFAGDCNGAAKTIALTPWLDGRNGDISTTFKLQSARHEQQWSLALQLPDIHGQLGGDKLAGQLDLATADGEVWHLRKLELASGPNKLSGSGKFGTQNQLRIDIDAANLARLYPQLGGTFNGSALLTGEWPQPNLQAQWRGTQLRYDAAKIARLQGELTLRKLGDENSSARIEINQFSYADRPTLDLTLAISGNREQQQLTFNAQQRTHQLRLQCATQPSRNWLDWQLNCPELSGSVQNSALHENWKNNNAITGHATLEPAAPTATTGSRYTIATAELKPFCLRAKDAELCLDQPLRYERNTLLPTAAHANALPLRWLALWLPEELQLQNDARANMRMQLQSIAPLRADAHLEIASTQWQWYTASGSQTAAINNIAVDAKLDEQRAVLMASAHSPTLGELSSQLNVIDPRAKRELDGHVRLERIQLAGFAWLVQGLDGLSGEVNGDIRIAGTAQAPLLQGQLLLKDGSANWAPLGAPFRTINADLTFDNTSAKLGGWFALGQGGGDIDGAAHWDGAGDNWQSRLTLIAGGLSAMPLPNSTVVFSPHIDMNAQPNEIRVTGYVDVASAEITIKQLPPETVDVSQDQRISGQHVDADETKFWADLGLNLGDKFHFSGLGADVNLSGRLKIAKTPGDSLHVNGEVRVPRGRYRAYGQRLSIRKGSFIFYGPLENPDLNLEAVREMPPGVTDVVGLRVIGSLKTPEALLFSEPSLPDSDIAYYLLTGRRPTTGSTTNQYSASGALLSLGLAGSEDRAGKLASKFGISDLQLGTSEDSSGNTEAEISGQLGQDLYVRYGRGLGQRSNSISFQYRLTPKLMIETISGIEDALDLLYSFEIK